MMQSRGKVSRSEGRYKMEPLYFRENASRGEKAIVFVHGGGISGRLWQPTLEALPEYHCLAPDLPGFGKSSHITPFSSENAVEGLAHLIRVNVPSGHARWSGFRSARSYV